MSKKIRRTEINIETHEITVIRVSGGQNPIYYERCRCEITAFATEKNAIFSQSVTTDEIHSTETLGELLICRNSPESRKN